MPTINSTPYSEPLSEDAIERIKALYTRMANAIRKAQGQEMSESDHEAIKKLATDFIADKSRDDLRNHIEAIYAPMAEGALPAFSDDDLEALHALIMFTLEFEDYLRRGRPSLKAICDLFATIFDPAVPMPAAEACAMDDVSCSTFSAIDSFRKVSCSYNGLIGTIKSELVWSEVTVPSLKKLFLQIFPAFAGEPDFHKKCRLLLDLFKIQIVIAVLSTE